MGRAVPWAQRLHPDRAGPPVRIVPGRAPFYHVHSPTLVPSRCSVTVGVGSLGAEKVTRQIAVYGVVQRKGDEEWVGRYSLPVFQGWKSEVTHRFLRQQFATQR